MITADQARALFLYDPDTGAFRWKPPVPAKAQRNNGLAGTKDRDGYTVIRIAGRGYKAHRLAWLMTHGAWPEGLIDHINFDRSDNRIVNLRVVSTQENARHKDPGKVWGRSGVRGVSWYSPYGKWKATFWHNKKHYFVGCYTTIEDAAKALAERRVSVVASAKDS